MAPRTSASTGITTPRDKWVPVTWMPHTSLSQTSHVCLSVRSAHASLDPLKRREHPEEEWNVKVGVYAIGGLPLVPISFRTPGAVVSRRKPLSKTDQYIRPCAKGTHVCYWDTFVQIPIRWRDLPRDSYLHFQVLQRGIVQYEATLPFFSLYGRLETGLQKIELLKGPLIVDRNFGVHDSEVDGPTSDNLSDEDDQIWKASCILYQLERFEEPGPKKIDSFGQVPSVPWLDTIMKERAREILVSESAVGEVSFISVLYTVHAIILQAHVIFPKVAFANRGGASIFDY
jgi:hypothetical protein